MTTANRDRDMTYVVCARYLPVQKKKICKLGEEGGKHSWLKKVYLASWRVQSYVMILMIAHWMSIAGNAGGKREASSFSLSYLRWIKREDPAASYCIDFVKAIRYPCAILRFFKYGGTGIYIFRVTDGLFTYMCIFVDILDTFIFVIKDMDCNNYLWKIVIVTS